MFYLLYSYFLSSTIDEYSLVGLSKAECAAEPIVLLILARICYESDRVSDKAELCT
jgi:hypothetical protein